ncbi:hypothetical protein LOAG_10784 [Loa loa]|uniref:Uncharacterized protein n=1 Tax=Loa loa TaxID=7209 RepID=A0A1S0TP76_LOALO|nr:hypothetical protein LOAG_10784 [Loa loa]EFO17714.1 hypothetical protein LOAG_10784 [Loa loa]
MNRSVAECPLLMPLPKPSHLTTDPGLAFEVIAAEAQDEKVNVTEHDDHQVTNDQASTHDKETTSEQASTTHQHDHAEADEAVKEHGKSEPKLLKVRATVEDEQGRQNGTTAKDEAEDHHHPKELKLHKEEKPETSSTTAAETNTTETL